MGAGDAQWVLTAIARASEATAPTVQREFERAYGSAWLQFVNAERVARGHPAGRGLHDHRFVLALVAHEPALAHVFDDGQREAARQLNGMANSLAHNEPLRAGDAHRAQDLAARLGASGALVPQATSASTPYQLLDRVLHGAAQVLSHLKRPGEELALAFRAERQLAGAEQWNALEPHNHDWSGKTSYLISCAATRTPSASRSDGSSCIPTIPTRGRGRQKS